MSQIQNSAFKLKLLPFLAGASIVVVTQFLATSCVQVNESSSLTSIGLPHDSVTAHVLKFHNTIFNLPIPNQDSINTVEGELSYKISLAEPIELNEGEDGLKFRMHGYQSIFVDDVERIKKRIFTSGLVFTDAQGSLMISDFLVLGDRDMSHE